MVLRTWVPLSQEREISETLVKDIQKLKMVDAIDAVNSLKDKFEELKVEILRFQLQSKISAIITRLRHKCFSTQALLVHVSINLLLINTV